MLEKRPKTRKNLYFRRGFVIGAAIQIRTGDLILTKELKNQHYQDFPPLILILYEAFQFSKLIRTSALAYVSIDFSG